MELREPDRADLVELNRTRLRLWEWGDERAPAVICIHGAFDHGRMWDGLAPELAARGHRVVAPDLRGHGDSGRLFSGNTWEPTTLDLALLARRLGGPVGLVGHSFGGGQAMAVAGTWPELVRWVVNIDGIGPSASVFDQQPALAEAAGAGLAAARRVRSGNVRVYASLDDMAARRQAVNVRLPSPWVDHLVRHGAAEVEGGYAWKADPMFNVGLPGDFDVDHLHAEHELVRCPVLVLTGGEDDTWSDMSAEEIEDRLGHLSDARHRVVEGAGHYVHIEQPEAVLAAIDAFLDEVAA